jgi:hypothetical protein
MPLFVTVTPGTTVSASTTLDASTLNLLGTPSVDVTGTVDGGSVSITNGSVPLASLVAQANATIVGNGSGASNSPVALDASADFTFNATTMVIKDDAVTYAKMQNVSNDNRLLGRAGGGTNVAELTVGSGLLLSSGELSGPNVAINTVLSAPVTGIEVKTVRADAVTISDLTTSITTRAANSKVLVSFNISYSISNTTSVNCFILTRAIGAGTDVELAVPSSPSNRVYGIKALGYQQNNATQINNCIQFLDSPGSVGVITYKLKIYGNAAITPTATGGFFINRTSADSSPASPNLPNCTRATSQVILQEIFA